jgi:NAD(P)H-dependent FMN reductase
MVVAVLLGSVRSERMGDRAAKWVAAELEKRGHEVVLVDAAVFEASDARQDVEGNKERHVIQVRKAA